MSTRAEMPAQADDPLTLGLSGQVAVVTGAGAGIGQGIAIGLARCGVDVVVADIDPARAEVTAGQVEEAGRRSAVVATDVRDSEQVTAMVEATTDRFGRLDILVNNAGGVRRAPFLEQSERSWRRHIDMNLVSVLAGISAAAPVMIEGGRGGSILNVVSIEAARAAPNYAVYAACKAAVVNFTRTMALELGDQGVRVNAIAPDLVETPGILGVPTGPVPDPLPDRPPQIEAAARTYIPLGRTGLPDDCAGAAIFLCSNLGRYVTGATMPVDGGTWASSGWQRDLQDGGWQLFPT